MWDARSPMRAQRLDTGPSTELNPQDFLEGFLNHEAVVLISSPAVHPGPALTQLRNGCVLDGTAGQDSVRGLDGTACTRAGRLRRDADHRVGRWNRQQRGFAGAHQRDAPGAW